MIDPFTPDGWAVGLTGGIGSGKSTVAARLARHGAGVVDADAIARALTAPGGAALDAIRAQFGPASIGADGALDRAWMRQCAFANPQARAALEAIIHPLVAQATDAQAHHLLTQGAAWLVFDVPLLVESGRWRARVQHVLVVDCPVATQVARVVQRSGLSPDAVQAIIAAQASRSQRLAAADSVIYNDSACLNDLHAEVDAWVALAQPGHAAMIA